MRNEDRFRCGIFGNSHYGFNVFTSCIFCVSHTLAICSCRGNIKCIEKIHKPLFKQMKEVSYNVK